MVVTIIGCGLIGGSLAISMKASNMASHVIVVDNKTANAEEAVKLGIANEHLSLEAAVAKSDLVVLAIPVVAAANLLPKVLDLLPESAIVVDMGSTKAGICKSVDTHPKRKQFVAAHPIAGTENSGPSAAFNGLFENKVCIITDKEKSDDEALNQILHLLFHLKMRVIFMSAEEHDRHIAYVSHLSHITSFSLGLTVLDLEKSEKNIFNMAGSGFASTVRLAKSSPEMWAPIFKQNKTYLLEALEAYTNVLNQFKAVIASEDELSSAELMGKANEIRRILEGK